MFEFEDHNDDSNIELEKREILLKQDIESEKNKYKSENIILKQTLDNSNIHQKSIGGMYNPSDLQPSSRGKSNLSDSQPSAGGKSNPSDSEESSVSEETSLSMDDIEELKELICNWLDLDEKSKELSDQIKDLKLEKKQYETYILGFMDKANKKVIKSNDNTCTLRKDVKETKGSLKEEHILKTLSKILSNSEQAYKITQQIIEELPSKEVISLKKDKNNQKTFKKTKTTKKDI
jgi:hypothetical protein